MKLKYSLDVYKGACEVGDRLRHSEVELAKEIFTNVYPKLRVTYERAALEVFSSSDYPSMEQLLLEWI